MNNNSNNAMAQCFDFVSYDRKPNGIRRPDWYVGRIWIHNTTKMVGNKTGGEFLARKNSAFFKFLWNRSDANLSVIDDFCGCQSDSKASPNFNGELSARFCCVSLMKT